MIVGYEIEGESQPTDSLPFGVSPRFIVLFFQHCFSWMSAAYGQAPVRYPFIKPRRHLTDVRGHAHKCPAHRK